ncbi:MAG: hypothetical protein RSD22_11110 [Romboutsia sp.]
MCSKKKIGIIIPLISSLAIFFVIDKIILFMGDSVGGYLKYYTIAYILGCILERLISKLITKIK